MQKEIDETIKAVKDYYFYYKVYKESKKELEEQGFIILEPEWDGGVVKVVKEY